MQHPAPIGESIGEAIAWLQAHGVTAERMAARLRELRIELVLTAHPTAAKHRTVLSKLQRISDLLRHLQDLDLLPRERTEPGRPEPARPHPAVPPVSRPFLSPLSWRGVQE